MLNRSRNVQEIKKHVSDGEMLRTVFGGKGIVCLWDAVLNVSSERGPAEPRSMRRRRDRDRRHAILANGVREPAPGRPGRGKPTLPLAIFFAGKDAKAEFDMIHHAPDAVIANAVREPAPRRPSREKPTLPLEISIFAGKDATAEFDMIHHAPAVIGTLGDGGEDDDEEDDFPEGGYTMEEVAKHNKKGELAILTCR